jgi:hypothetical protein
MRVGRTVSWQRSLTRAKYRPCNRQELDFEAATDIFRHIAFSQPVELAEEGEEGKGTCRCCHMVTSCELNYLGTLSTLSAN